MLCNMYVMLCDAPYRNLGVTFDPHLSFSNHISNLYRSCFMHIRDLRRIRPMLYSKTASTIGTSIVHSKLDYCNSLFLNSLRLTPVAHSPLFLSGHKTTIV